MLGFRVEGFRVERPRDFGVQAFRFGGSGSRAYASSLVLVGGVPKDIQVRATSTEGPKH